MPEEFEAILGSRLDSIRQIAVPPVQTPDLHSVQYHMARMFNIPPQSSFQHILRNGIAMSSLLEAVMAMDNIEAYWIWILAFCIYSQFLLVSPSGDYDSKILNIINQV